MKLLTGIKPSAKEIHLGNYFGAIKPIIDFQDKYNVYLLIADLHALTSGFNIRDNILGLVKTILACGVNVLIFKQSDIKEHTYLAWIFSCDVGIGRMKRMHAYKDALEKNIEINTGTFYYPLLMAADILLYDPDYVPVGKDQKQHIELTIDIAESFNRKYGEIFKIPKELISEDTGIIPGIDGKKMSKSYNNYISLIEDENSLYKKVKSIVTDMIPIDAPKDPDKCNVYNILKYFLTEEENKEIRNKYINGGLAYSYVKELLFEKLRKFIGDIRKKYMNISDEEVLVTLKRGTMIAKEEASKKINLVDKILGLKLYE